MSTSQPSVSIVVPVRNEADNIAPLIAEIGAALDGRWAYEIIYINDGSTDATGERLAAIMKQRSNLRQLRHARSGGQSAAVRSGVRAARGDIVATLDGDGQNNPAFLPDLIAAVEKSARVGLAAGQRVGRKDTGFKKFQSRVANGVRNAILKDGTRDTGCGLKAFRRDVFLMLPYFDGLHRFLPALGAPGRLRDRLCRRDRPAAPLRRIKLRLLRPAVDRDHGSRRRVVADPPQEADS
ncbi:dolichol-phosphate mannosyltransferase [Bradyrhizobium sp. USDA 329]